MQCRSDCEHFPVTSVDDQIRVGRDQIRVGRNQIRVDRDQIRVGRPNPSWSTKSELVATKSELVDQIRVGRDLIRVGRDQIRVGWPNPSWLTKSELVDQIRVGRDLIRVGHIQVTTIRDKFWSIKNQFGGPIPVHEGFGSSVFQYISFSGRREGKAWLWPKMRSVGRSVGRWKKRALITMTTSLRPNTERIEVGVKSGHPFDCEFLDESKTTNWVSSASD